MFHFEKASWLAWSQLLRNRIRCSMIDGMIEINQWMREDKRSCKHSTAELISDDMDVAAQSFCDWPDFSSCQLFCANNNILWHWAYSLTIVVQVVTDLTPSQLAWWFYIHQNTFTTGRALGRTHTSARLNSLRFVSQWWAGSWSRPEPKSSQLVLVTYLTHPPSFVITRP